MEPINTNKQKKSSEITSLAKELAQPESKTILDDMTTMADSPEYQRSTPPETQGKLTAAIQAAKELHQREATKNDWLDVAQTLAGAVAQFGAARSGLRTGRDMSNIAMSPNTDWAGRTARSQRDYLETVRQAEQGAEAERRNWADTETTKKQDYSQKYEPLKERLRNAQQLESDEERARREAGLEGTREKKEQSRNDLQERRMELAELTNQEKVAREQLKARQTLVNQLQQEDLSTKDQKKLEAKYGSLAASGNVDLPQLQTELSSTDKPGKLWGTNPDPEARKSLLSSKVLETKNLLDSIAARKKELLGQAAPASVQSAEGKTSPSPGKDSQVEQYAKQYNLDYEQAKKVLVGRGYQPKE